MKDLALRLYFIYGTKSSKATLLKLRCKTCS